MLHHTSPPSLRRPSRPTSHAAPHAPLHHTSPPSLRLGPPRPGVVQPGGYTDASAGGLCKERHEPMDERQLVALQMLPFVKQHPTREAAAIDAAEAEERWVERERFAKRSLAGRPGGGIAGGGANLRPRVEEASLNPRRARERFEAVAAPPRGRCEPVRQAREAVRPKGGSGQSLSGPRADRLPPRWNSRRAPGPPAMDFVRRLTAV